MKNEVTEEGQAFDIVQINEHHLDRECIRLPHQFLQYATLAADKRRDVDEAKAELKVIEAEVARQIRADAEKNDQKLTEAGLKESIVLSPKVRKQQRQLRQCEHDLDVAQAVVSSLGIKKSSLSNLVELHAAGYHAAPKISAKGKEAVDEMRRQRNNVTLRRRSEQE